MPTGNSFIDHWVDQVRALTTPDRVVFCDGSEAERDRLTAECLASGELIALEPGDAAGLRAPSQRQPRRRAHRAPHVHQHDRQGRRRADQQLDGARRGAREADAAVPRRRWPGRTMYVVPFLMGPPGSRFSKVGVEITDSRYVVLNMRTMTRVGAGRARRARTGPTTSRAACTRSATCRPSGGSSCTSPKRTRSGRSDRATAATRCWARSAWRCAWPAGWREQEGWLAEHMLILGLQAPEGPHALRDRRVPVGVRQDQPGDAGAAGVDAGLEDLDGRRRHRVAASGTGRAAVGGQPGGRVLRRRAGHQPQDQPDGVRDDPAQHHLHQRRAAARRHAVVGGARRPGAGRGHRLAGPAVDAGIAEKAAHPNSRFTTPATECASLSPEFANPERRAHRRDPLRRASSAARAAGVRGAQLAARHVSRRDAVVGDDGRGHRQGRRAAARPDGDAAVLRLQHGRLLGPLARRRRRASRGRRASSASTGSAPARTASSCGQASATTCAC